MPRIDNSDETVIEAYELDFDEEDPGKTPPVDLCLNCYCAWLNADLKIEHSDYRDDRYYCIECGIRLIEEDND